MGDEVSNAVNLASLLSGGRYMHPTNALPLNSMTAKAHVRFINISLGYQFRSGITKPGDIL